MLSVVVVTKDTPYGLSLSSSSPKSNFDIIKELKNDAQKTCNQIYSNLISNKIQEWWLQQTRKPKILWIPIILGVRIVVAMELGAYAAYTASQNSDSIKKLAVNHDGQGKFMEALEQQIVTSHEKMDNYTQKLNKLVTKLKIIANDFEEFKGTYVNTVFETSALISKFRVKRMQISEAKRLWRES